MEKETHWRSLAKALSYRIVGTMVTFFTSLAITGNTRTAATIIVIDTALKIGGFYAHERLWCWIKIGRCKPPEYQI